MRSLTCKSHSMTSKRAIKNRPKDFDVLLSEYLHMHPPKSIPKAILNAVNLDAITKADHESSSLSLKSLRSDPDFSNTTDHLYASLQKRKSIVRYRKLFSLLESNRSNKTARPL